MHSCPSPAVVFFRLVFMLASLVVETSRDPVLSWSSPSYRQFANSIALWDVRKLSGPRSLEVFYHCGRGIILFPAQDPPKIQGRVLNVMERRVKITEKAPGTGIIFLVSIQWRSLEKRCERCEFPFCLWLPGVPYSHITHTLPLAIYLKVLCEFFLSSSVVPSVSSFCVLPQVNMCFFIALWLRSLMDSGKVTIL